MHMQRLDRLTVCFLFLFRLFLDTRLAMGFLMHNRFFIIYIGIVYERTLYDVKTCHVLWNWTWK